MSPDLSKLIFYSPDNAFKNVNKYSGSITFPTSVGAGVTSTVTSNITLTDTPVFTEFFCNFLELEDALNAVGSTQWYSENVAGNFGVGIHATAPSNTWINAGVYPVINGSIVTITGSVFNPFGSTVTLVSLTVPFVFVEYTLAN